MIKVIQFADDQSRQWHLDPTPCLVAPTRSAAPITWAMLGGFHCVGIKPRTEHSQVPLVARLAVAGRIVLRSLNLDLRQCSYGMCLDPWTSFIWPKYPGGI